MDEKELQNLYNSLSKHFDIGNYDTFKSKMQTPEQRKGFYDVVGKNGFDLGDYNQYEQRIGGVKKKVGGEKPKDYVSAAQSTSPNYKPETPFTTNVSELPQPEEKLYEGNPLELANKAYELSRKGEWHGTGNTGGGGGAWTSDVAANEEGAKIDKQLKSQGYNPEKIRKDLNDIPEYAFKTIPKEELFRLYKDNPALYERNVATMKWQSKLHDNIFNAEKNGDINTGEANSIWKSVQSVLNSTEVGDYYNQRRRIKDIYDTVKRFGGDNTGEIIRNLGVDFSKKYGYAAAHPEQTTALDELSVSGKLNSVELAAYNYIQDLMPEQVNKYKAAFIDDEKIKGNYDAELAKQEAKKQLHDIGSQLGRAYIAEHPMDAEGADYLARTENLKSARYPRASAYEARNFAQELLGQDKGFFKWMGAEAGKATENTARGVWDMVATPFRSDESNELNQAEILGRDVMNESSTYLTQDKQLDKTFKPYVSEELQKQIDTIKAKDISDKQKQEEVSDLLVKNQGQWDRTPIEGGKTNINLTSLIYGVGGLAANLAPFMVAEAMTGGGASATLAKKLTSTFVSAAATSFEDAYTQAVKEGASNPYAKAMRVTAINSAAMAGAMTPDAIRKMLLGKNKTIGELVSKMTDDEIMATLKKAPKPLQQFKEGFKQYFGEVAQGAKSGAKITAFTTAGQVVNDDISGELKSPHEYAKQAALETLKFGVFSAITPTAKGIKQLVRPTDLQLANVMAAAQAPEAYLREIDKLEKDGDVSPSDAAQIKSNIEKVGAIYSKSVVLKNDKINDAAKREYLYNEMVKMDAKEASASLPQKQSEAADKAALVADFKNSLILEPKTEKQLEARKAQLEKELIPEKDGDGNNKPINDKLKLESEAEIEAINHALSQAKKEVKEQPKEQLIKKLEGNEILKNVGGTDAEKVKYLQEQAISAPESFARKINDEQTHIDLISKNTPQDIEAAIEYQQKRLTQDNADIEVIDKGITLLEKGLEKAKEPPKPFEIPEEVAVTEPMQQGGITEIKPEPQQREENGAVVEKPITQPEPITIGENGEEIKQEPAKATEQIPSEKETAVEGEVIEVSEGAGGEPPKEVKHDFVYENDGDKRVSGLMRHIQEAKGISTDTKKAFEENGIEYAIADNKESRRVAKEIINTLGQKDALQVARGEDMHPSVRSAIFAESIDNSFKAEQEAKVKGDKEAQLKAAAEWASISREYDKKLTGSGQFSQYANHFYKTSSLGFVLKKNAETNKKFEAFMEGNEKNIKEVFDELVKTDEGKLFFEGKVEEARKEERKADRKKRDKKIDDFFDSLKADSDKLYSAPIPPSLWNGAMDVMKIAVKGGDRVVDAIKAAIDHISKQIGDDWDKEKFRADFEKKLKDAADGNAKDRSYEEILQSRMDELKRRMEENDYSDEAYKGKRTLSEKEKATQDEYKKVKAEYDEAKKKSKEYTDKKAKQYLDQFRSRLSGMDEKQKEEVIRRAAKKLIDAGALQYEDFRSIIADVMGFKELTPEQVKRAEELVKEINGVDDIEAQMVENPTAGTIKNLEEARKKSIVAQLELYNMTSNKSDIVQTVKSLITGNLMGIPTLFVNLVANPIYQLGVRFPKDIIKNIGEHGLWAITKAANNFWGSEIYNPKLNTIEAQKGYWKMGAKGLKNAIFNFKKGTENKDYFGNREYQTALAPRVAKAELQAFKRGELYLNKTERIDRWIRKSWMGRQADFILRGMQFGDNPPRWAAEGATAIQIAKNELKLEDVNEVEAFMLSPEKYAKKVFMKQGKSEAQANKLAKEVQERIIFEGEKAVLQEDNLLSKASSYIDSGLRKNKDEGYGMSAVKGTGSILKTMTFPFIKIPGNFAWQSFKLAVPEVAFGQSAIQYAKAFSSIKKGDSAAAKRYLSRANDNFAHGTLGLTMRLAAQSLVAAGYTRSSNDEDAKRREREGERIYGKQNQLNFGKMMGGNDFWVDFKYFGPFGVVLNTQSKMSDKDRKEQAKENDSYVSDLYDRVNYSGFEQLNNLVFNNGSKLVDAMRGGEKPFQDWTVNSMNTISNIFTGATYVALSKALLPEQVRVNGDGVVQDIINNQKQRNILLRLAVEATGGKGNPPSKISIWGEPIKNDRSITGILGNMLGWEKGSQDIFGAILYNDYKRTGDAKFFPTTEDNKFSVGGKQITLQKDEQDRLNVLVGQARKTLVRAFVYDQVNQYDGKVYSQLSDDKKIEALKNVYDLGKQIAYSQFKQEFPQYAKEITDEEKRQKKETSKDNKKFKKSFNN